MRSPGVIYRRYRQIRKKILYDRIGTAFRCAHENCHYGKIVTYRDGDGCEHTINVCNYNPSVSEGVIELCTDPVTCNAFVNKWNKDKITQEVDKELSDPSIKKDKYPELAILEWALDKDLNDAIKNPGFFGNIIISCIAFLEKILRSK